MLKITHFFYDKINDGYLKGNALSDFNILTAIILCFIRVTSEQKYCALIL